MFGRPISLRQRTALYILAPVFFLLITIELISFRYIKTLLLNQMQTTGISHLQRTANHIDTQLRRPKTLLTKLTGEPSEEIRVFLAETIRSLEGVVELNVTQHASFAHDVMPTNDNSTRALIRSEIEHAKDLSSCIGRVNRLLSRDTESSGDFSTLFLLSLDHSNRSVRWIRAGHEPAMLYNLEGTYPNLFEVYAYLPFIGV